MCTNYGRDNMVKGKPFVKWAGGKRQIMNELLKYVPENYNTFYEPFVGIIQFLWKKSSYQ